MTGQIEVVKDLTPGDKPRRVPMFIHGEEVHSLSENTFHSVNPATGEIIGLVDSADDESLAAAERSAREGLDAWSGMSGGERGRILRRAADILRSRNDELARIEVLDTGKPIREAITVDIASGADCLEFFAGAAALMHGEYFDLGDNFAYVRREPLGVCAGIGAWNYPLQIAAWKSAPALAAGNSMIFKPSELTPMTAVELARIYTEAGVPNGVFNVVHGDQGVGEALVKNPNIAKVSLTGHQNTGRAVMKDAAATLKHVTLELGGKSPILVFDDANLENAVTGSLVGNFFTQGEICSNGTRVFVHRGVHQDFVQMAMEKTSDLKIGDPLDVSTHVGPLISAEHQRQVLAFIESGRSQGAIQVIGGGQPDIEGLEGGYFVEPTIFDHCADDMKIVKEEIFGPVMSVLPFDSEDEAIRRANDTPFGLAAGVFTRDISRAHRIAERLQSGTVWINTYNITPVEVPFGGFKQSGLGKENSLAALDYYSQRKAVYVEIGNMANPF